MGPLPGPKSCHMLCFGCSDVSVAVTDIGSDFDEDLEQESSCLCEQQVPVPVKTPPTELSIVTIVAAMHDCQYM